MPEGVAVRKPPRPGERFSGGAKGLCRRVAHFIARSRTLAGSMPRMDSGQWRQACNTLLQILLFCFDFCVSLSSWPWLVLGFWCPSYHYSSHPTTHPPTQTHTHTSQSVLPRCCFNLKLPPGTQWFFFFFCMERSVLGDLCRVIMKFFSCAGDLV